MKWGSVKQCQVGMNFDLLTSALTLCTCVYYMLSNGGEHFIHAAWEYIMTFRRWWNTSNNDNNDNNTDSNINNNNNNLFYTFVFWSVNVTLFYRKADCVHLRSGCPKDHFHQMSHIYVSANLPWHSDISTPPRMYVEVALTGQFRQEEDDVISRIVPSGHSSQFPLLTSWVPKEHASVTNHHLPYILAYKSHLGLWVIQSVLLSMTLL